MSWRALYPRATKFFRLILGDFRTKLDESKRLQTFKTSGFCRNRLAPLGVAQPAIHRAHHGLGRYVRIAFLDGVHHRDMHLDGLGLLAAVVGQGDDGQQREQRRLNGVGEGLEGGLLGRDADRQVKTQIGFGELAPVSAGAGHGGDRLAQPGDIGACAIERRQRRGCRLDRTSVRCAKKSMSRPTLARHDKTTESNQFQWVGSSTVVPTFILDTTTPFAANVLITSRVTTRKTPNILCMSASLGMRSPGLRAPDKISSPRVAAILPCPVRREQRQSWLIFLAEAFMTLLLSPCGTS